MGQSGWARNFTYDAENRQVSATINTAASAYQPVSKITLR